MRVMSLGDNVDAEGAPMVAQSIYTIGKVEIKILEFIHTETV